MVFDFTGGNHLDSAVDDHIHSARIQLVDADHIEGLWNSYSGGEEAATQILDSARPD